MADVTPEEPPALFHGLYTLFCWAGLVALTAALGWLVWMLFSHTEPGTTRELSLAAARPTIEALQTRPVAVAGASAGSPGAAPLVELPAVCAACHTIAGTSAAGTLGPDLSHIGTVAAEIIKSPSYTGKATTAEGYIRESVVDPNAYIVAGAGYTAAPGVSTMSPSLANAFSPAELDRLAAQLAALR